MNINALIKKIQEELDDIDLTQMSPDTVFREIDGWNSLYALVLMALVSTEYHVELSGQQVRAIITVQDLYDIISNTPPDDA